MTTTTSMQSSSSRAGRPIREDMTRRLLEELAPGSGPVGDRPLADSLLYDAWRERATDIHLDPQSGGARLRFRIDGVMVDGALLTADQAHRLGNQLRAMAGLDPITEFVPREARWTYEIDDAEVDLRLTTAPCLNGEMIAVRLLDPTRVKQNIHDLGLGEDHRALLELWLPNISGMFMVTGPTGSGKTTTLYALLHELRSQARAIVTIEDPVEYEIDGVAQMQVDDRHGLTFAKGIKTMLRLDPDYLMVGEIRDADSARAAVDAAIAGRAVLSTIHSRDAAGAVAALRNWGLKNHEIAVCLSVVISQRLVRRLCPECRVQAEPTEQENRWLKLAAGAALDHVWRPRGCPKCRHLGYHDRVGIFEAWRLDEHDYTQILNDADDHMLRQNLLAGEHRPLIADGVEKVAQGITSLDELRAICESDVLLTLKPTAKSRRNNSTRNHSGNRASNNSKAGNGKGDVTRRRTPKASGAKKT